MNELIERTERYWLSLHDASTMVLVRTWWAIVVLGWSVSVLPDFGAIFGSDGLQPPTEFKQYRVFTLFRWIDGDSVRVGAMAVLLVAALAVALGRMPRVTVPLTAALHLSFIDVHGPWSIGAEGVLMIWGVYMAAFALLTPQHLQGHFADDRGSRGLAPAWGLRLFQIQLVVAYLSTASSKARGNDWTDGSAVYHVLASPTLRRFELPSVLFDNVWVIRSMTWGVLALEFALAPLLLWPRTRKLGIVLALLMHLAFGAFLALGFFAAAMSIGILAFVPPATARRLLDAVFGRRRAPTTTADDPMVAAGLG